MKDALGDRMKLYEKNNVVSQFVNCPIVARIDGRAFSKFTKGMCRPFDHRMTHCMVETTKALVEQTGCDVGYTQSDEISLVWKNDNYESQVFFNGKMQKMVSQLAAIATLEFNILVRKMLPDFVCKKPTFDCRVFFVPNLMEAYNCLLWRRKDAERNSASMLAMKYFSANQLHKRSHVEKLEMIQEAGDDWNVYPDYFKYGVYITRQTTEKSSRKKK